MSKIEILLVEDNPGDVELTRTAFEVAHLESNLNVTCDGDKALDYLHNRGEYRDANRPDIILLDMNLPNTDGREVLSELAKSSDLKLIPTIMLSSSTAENDITDAYALNVNCYIVKPDEAKKYIEVVAAVENFWSKTCRLPANKLVS